MSVSINLAWRKSSFSDVNECVELAWRTSSFSDHIECVEMAWPGDAIFVRDSKHPSGPVLMFEHSRFGRLLASFGR
jgi:hypothetical protein